MDAERLAGTTKSFPEEGKIAAKRLFGGDTGEIPAVIISSSAWHIYMKIKKMHSATPRFGLVSTPPFSAILRPSVPGHSYEIRVTIAIFAILPRTR
jgi:hypothetical protein